MMIIYVKNLIFFTICQQPLTRFQKMKRHSIDVLDTLNIIIDYIMYRKTSFSVYLFLPKYHTNEMKMFKVHFHCYVRKQQYDHFTINGDNYCLRLRFTYYFATITYKMMFLSSYNIIYIIYSYINDLMTISDIIRQTLREASGWSEEYGQILTRQESRRC